VHQALAGDGTLTARVTSLWAQHLADDCSFSASSIKTSAEPAK
jgi:hypothetical protein